MLTSRQIRKRGDALLSSISLLSLLFFFFFFSAQAPSPWAVAAAVPIQVKLSSLSQSSLETLSWTPKVCFVSTIGIS